MANINYPKTEYTIETMEGIVVVSIDHRDYDMGFAVLLDSEEEVDKMIEELKEARKEVGR